MAVQVPLLVAELCAIVLETFFYGVFFVLFILSVSLAITRDAEASKKPGRREGRAGPKRTSLYRTPVFLASVIMAMAITAHWILAVDRLFLAFIHSKVPILFYARLTDITEVVKTGLLTGTLLISDSFIIYRLWVVWSYDKWVVLPPLCTLVGLLVTGVGLTYQFTQPIPDDNVFLSVAGRWITSNCVFILVTNIYCTAMISWRILTVNRDSAKLGGSSLKSVLAIIVESAAIITTQTLFYTICYESGSGIQTILLNIWAPIAGIAFMLINVRVGLGWAQQSRQSDTEISTIRYGSGAMQSSEATTSWPMHPVLVDVNKATDEDTHQGHSSTKDFRGEVV
ncbi:hypothetical protein DFH06DRAFT_1217648 [Mycena polygramma]|nr:hypothetical protein DFH06DRAFT_1217648 [Mycena polygramma]